MGVLCGNAGLAGMKDKAAVGHPAVVLSELFFGNEVHGSPVVRKIIGHRNDLSFDFLFICAFFCYHEAFSLCFSPA